jgi:hypothetical protein
VALSTEANENENEKDSYILPAAASESSSMPPIMDSWLSANVSAIRLVQKDFSFTYGVPNSPIIRSAISKASWLVHGFSFTVRFIPIPALPELMVVFTLVPIFLYRPTLSLVLSSIPPEPFSIPPPAFRLTLILNTLAIDLFARLFKWVIDMLCRAFKFLEVKPSWAVKYWLQFLGIVSIPDLYTRLAALLEFLDWSLRAQGLKGLGIS